MSLGGGRSSSSPARFCGMVAWRPPTLATRPPSVGVHSQGTSRRRTGGSQCCLWCWKPPPQSVRQRASQGAWKPVSSRNQWWAPPPITVWSHRVALPSHGLWGSWTSHKKVQAPRAPVPGERGVGVHCLWRPSLPLTRHPLRHVGWVAAREAPLLEWRSVREFTAMLQSLHGASVSPYVKWAC